MLLNLSKSFHFDLDQKEFHIDYMFTTEVMNGGAENDICLVMKIVEGYSNRKTHKVTKPLNTLYLSNEEIEKMVEKETVSYFNN